MSPSVLVSAFRKSGIYPLNRNQTPGEVLVSSTKPSNEEDSHETGSTQTTATVQAFDALETALSTPARKNSVLEWKKIMTWTEAQPSWLGKSFTPTLARLASKRSQQTVQTRPPNQTLEITWCFKQGRQPPIS